ncbi:MAG TPA: hypothetical protein VK951_02095, partial [Miltoncostaeaceae bacterium]|nr:hypothetical protein [Miltoncostaeaceae bacterium]
MSPTPTARIRRPRIVVTLVAGCLVTSAAPALALETTPPPSKAPTDVAIAKASDRDGYQPGETIVYTITVTNVGGTAVPRAAILVSDPMLADLAPADGGGTAGADLAPGASIVYVGTHVASADDCGPLSNTATVELRSGKRAGEDANPANDGATHAVDVSGEACAP